MNGFYLSQGDWSNVYYVRYHSGKMGDFLTSLLIYSFRKKYLPPGAFAVENFEYLPHCKRWMSYSSDGNLILKESKVLDETALYNELSARVDNYFPFVIANERPIDIHSDKCFKNINLVRPSFANNLVFMAPIMKIYKHSLDISIPSQDKVFSNLTGQKFHDECKGVLDAYRREESKIDYSNLYRIDIFKLIFEKDAQELKDIIDVNDLGIINMLELAKRDVLDIAEYFDIDFMSFYNSTNKIITTNKVLDLYRKCLEIM
jgi:hypothetical protein